MSGYDVGNVSGDFALPVDANVRDVVTTQGIIADGIVGGIHMVSEAFFQAKQIRVFEPAFKYAALDSLTMVFKLVCNFTQTAAVAHVEADHVKPGIHGK